MVRDDHSLPMMFMVILSTWTQETSEMIKQDADYAAAESDRDPILLLPIRQKTHRQPQSGAFEMDADTAWSRLYTLVQGSGSLSAHK